MGGGFQGPRKEATGHPRARRSWQAERKSDLLADPGERVGRARLGADPQQSPARGGGDGRDPAARSGAGTRHAHACPLRPRSSGPLPAPHRPSARGTARGWSPGQP